MTNIHYCWYCFWLGCNAQFFWILEPDLKMCGNASLHRKLAELVLGVLWRPSTVFPFLFLFSKFILSFALLFKASGEAFVRSYSPIKVDWQPARPGDIDLLVLDQC